MGLCPFTDYAYAGVSSNDDIADAQQIRLLRSSLLIWYILRKIDSLIILLLEFLQRVIECKYK
jgi:hypothetical protein